MDEIDIWRAANVLVNQRGDKATLHAASQRRRGRDSRRKIQITSSDPAPPVWTLSQDCPNLRRFW